MVGLHSIGIMISIRPLRQVIFQKNQVGEPKSFCIRCSTTSFCLSCTLDDNKSVISCIDLGSTYLFRYHHRKVRVSCSTNIHVISLYYGFTQESNLLLLVLELFLIYCNQFQRQLVLQEPYKAIQKLESYADIDCYSYLIV